jgi:uncharacterized protein
MATLVESVTAAVRKPTTVGVRRISGQMIGRALGHQRTAVNEASMTSDLLYKRALELAQQPQVDPILTLAALKEAAAAGSGNAIYALATWYLFGKNVDVDLLRAVRLLKQAVKAKIPKAYFDLAVCYEKGAGTKKNDQKAIEHYINAALTGDAQAIHAVGRCYWHGIGRDRDRRVAKIWLDRAHELGYRQAD